MGKVLRWSSDWFYSILTSFINLRVEIFYFAKELDHGQLKFRSVCISHFLEHVLWFWINTIWDMHTKRSIENWNKLKSEHVGDLNEHVLSKDLLNWNTIHPRIGRGFRGHLFNSILLSAKEFRHNKQCSRDERWSVSE